MNKDKDEINALIEKFFQAFTNKGSQLPDWSIVHQTCMPEVVIIKKVGLEQEIYSLESFIAPRKKLLSNGTLVDFEEWEVRGQSVVFGNIAQHKSDYCKKGVLNGKAFSQSGIKIFQLVKTNLGWRIASLIWEDN